MSTDWQLLESGPADATNTVLLLPGGMCGAESFAEVMAQPALGRLRLVAATMPGHAGAAPLKECSMASYARASAVLAAGIRADVVAGFSMGASVAVEMVTSGAFTGPVVLSGVSLSSPDEPAFFRGLVALGRVLGGIPVRLLGKATGVMLKQMRMSTERQAELRADFGRNDPAVVRRILLEYTRWLRQDEQRAVRLCRAGVPTWTIHTEKGDGGLTDGERSTLEACPNARLVTIPGSVFFLPVEAPEPLAAAIAEAVAFASRP